MSQEKPSELDQVVKHLRRRILEAAYRAGGGHVGGSLSVVPALVALYGSVMRHSPTTVTAPDRDRLIYSKGHCSLALYAVLEHYGYLESGELDSFMGSDSRLAGHSEHFHLPAVEVTAGSLGHGLPVAAGIALAQRYTPNTWQTFCICGDGELNEGSVWEAIMFASQHELGRLTLIVDANGYMSLDTVDAILGIEPIAGRLEAFGWTVRTVDGNSASGLLEGIVEGRDPQRPHAVIARSRKGEGVPFMYGDPKWHYRAPTDFELASALASLEES